MITTMKKSIIFVLFVFVFSTFLVGCNNNQPKTAAPKTKPTTTKNKDTAKAGNPKSNTARNLYLVVEPSGKLGPDGKMHDAFINGDITLTEGKPVTLHFLNYDGGTHTYTSADLGLNVKIKGSTKKGTPMETAYTFTPIKPEPLTGTVQTSVMVKITNGQ